MARGGRVLRMFALTSHMFFLPVIFAKTLHDVCFTVTEYIYDNEVQVDRNYQSFNQITF